MSELYPCKNESIFLLLQVTTKVTKLVTKQRVKYHYCYYVFYVYQHLTRIVLMIKPSLGN